jgi:hypothetical protein
LCESADAQVDDIAIGVMGYVVPIGITLVGVYLAYTGFNDVSDFSVLARGAVTAYISPKTRLRPCTTVRLTLPSPILTHTLFVLQVLRTFESGWQSVAGEPAQEVFV